MNERERSTSTCGAFEHGDSAATVEGIVEEVHEIDLDRIRIERKGWKMSLGFGFLLLTSHFFFFSFFFVVLPSACSSVLPPSPSVLSFSRAMLILRSDVGFCFC